MTLEQRIEQLTANFQKISKEELVEILLNLRNGSHTFGSVIARTEPKMNKKGNPFYGKTIKLSHWSFGMNTEFYPKLSNKMEKKGLDTANIVKVSSNYEHYLDKPNCPILKLKSDPTKLFLCVFPNRDLVTLREFYLDNELANEFQTAQIKAWIKQNKPSPKQTALGLEEDEQILIRTISLDNIVGITVDKKSYRVA